MEAITPLPYPNVIKIVALNAGTSGNKNTYLKDELIRAARTMNGKPIYFGTSHDNVEKREIGIINWAEFESDRVEAVGTIDPEIYHRIQNGEIPHVSIEANFILPERINGIAPKGLEFTGLLLLPKGVAPGDPKTSVVVMERIGEILHDISSSQEDWVKLHEAGKALTKEVAAPTSGSSNTSQDKPSPNLGDSGRVQERPEYPWDQCISDMKSQGHDDDSAAKICAAIKNRTVSRTLELGLAKTPEEARKVVAEKVKSDPLFSYLAGKVQELQKGPDQGVSSPLGKDTSETQSKPNSSLADADKKALEQLTRDVQSLFQGVGELRQAVGNLQSSVRGLIETKPKGKGIVSSPMTRDVSGLTVREVNFEATQFSDLLRKPDGQEGQNVGQQKEVNQ